MGVTIPTVLVVGLVTTGSGVATPTRGDALTTSSVTGSPCSLCGVELDVPIEDTVTRGVEWEGPTSRDTPTSSEEYLEETDIWGRVSTVGSDRDRFCLGTSLSSVASSSSLTEGKGPRTVTEWRGIGGAGLSPVGVVRSRGGEGDEQIVPVLVLLVVGSCDSAPWILTGREVRRVGTRRDSLSGQGFVNEVGGTTSEYLFCPHTVVVDGGMGVVWFQGLTTGPVEWD